MVCFLLFCHGFCIPTRPLEDETQRSYDNEEARDAEGRKVGSSVHRCPSSRTAIHPCWLMSEGIILLLLPNILIIMIIIHIYIWIILYIDIYIYICIHIIYVNVYMYIYLDW